MPASSSALRHPESSPPPASCCRRESAAALPRNKQRHARVLPETLPSSLPETPPRNSRRTAASPWRSSAPCISLRRPSPRLLRNPLVLSQARGSVARTSPVSAPAANARSPSRSCSRPRRRTPAATGRRSASPYAVASLGCSCLLSDWRRSRRSTAPAWAALPAVPAGSPAAPNTAASCVRSRVRSQTPAPPHARSCLPPTRPAEHVHRSPRCTSLRCPTNLPLSTTVRETKIRRSTFSPPHHPLSRRDAVYFRSGVYIRVPMPKDVLELPIFGTVCLLSSSLTIHMAV